MKSLILKYLIGILFKIIFKNLVKIKKIYWNFGKIGKLKMKICFLV